MSDSRGQGISGGAAQLLRLMIAASHGRSGKTTLSIGLLAAYRARGLAVQPFKKGPDYIDASWLAQASGRPCRSLDSFFYDRPAALYRAFVRGSHGAQLALIEANHGLFDSIDNDGRGSAARIARMLAVPILLVVNTARLGRTAAAIVRGCQTFEENTPIVGVLLNQVAHSRHETRLRRAIEQHCGLPVLGAIPRDDILRIPDRHLGLIPQGEASASSSAIESCRRAVEQHADLDAIWKVACKARPFRVATAGSEAAARRPAQRVRIGVLRDGAFSFYYPENLEALEAEGAELVFIDAIRDSGLPPVDALYLGGGFPEVFMDELAANASLRGGIRSALEGGLPAYAECGGMMYLSHRITWGERSAEMVGLLPCEVEMTSSPQAHGYAVVQVDTANPFFEPGGVMRGHEFHNSRLIVTPAVGGAGKLRTAYAVLRGRGLDGARDGIVVHNVLASYVHLHVGGAPAWAAGLVRAAAQHRNGELSHELIHGRAVA